MVNIHKPNKTQLAQNLGAVNRRMFVERSSVTLQNKNLEMYNVSELLKQLRMTENNLKFFSSK